MYGYKNPTAHVLLHGVSQGLRSIRGFGEENRNVFDVRVRDARLKTFSHISGQFKHQSLLKNSDGSNGIETHNLYNAGAMLYRLSHEATQLGAAHMFMCTTNTHFFHTRHYHRIPLVWVVHLIILKASQ